MKKRIHFSLCFGLVCAVLLSMSHFSAACDDLRQNVLRLHIIANSDSEADQQLKLKIRDEILLKTDGMFLNSCDLETAQNTVFENLSLFEQIANNVIEENGFEYKAKASLGISEFSTRYYDDFTLPAGDYQSLIITLGKGEGKNWWCVVYPTVCIPAAAKGELSDTVCEESVQIAKNEKRYVMRFKAVEIYEKIKKYINR
ncbi:MAG: stage II sporulation protein R [Clostridia bacterium]|nr:stage II sporulation protein R [Clostridia bacterium]MBQ3057325.1 stage II sporulation protein R [Clostridia bacterium]